MSFVKTSAFRGLSSDSDDIKIDSSGNVAFTNNNIVNKNLLINGGMNVWQRGTSQASIITAGYYTTDRWRTGGSGLGAFTQSRSTDVPSGQGFSYSLKMDCTTADASQAASDNLNIQHRIEGQNLQHLLKGSSSAKKVTLSFWVKSNKTGTYIIELADVDNTRHICKAYTIDSASTWEKKELTFDGDTTGAFDNDNASSLEILWYLGVGSDRSSGTLATSWATRTDANKAVGQVNLADSTSNEWYMTGCQLEVGENASGFEFEPYEKVERKCYRYYYKTSGNMFVDTVGATYNGLSQTRFAHHCNIHTPVTMRIAPTGTITYQQIASTGQSAYAFISSLPERAAVRNQNSGTSTQGDLFLGYTLDSEL